MNLIKFVLASAFLFSTGDLSHAEPWLSNRFSQNCAACHAPSRINRPVTQRRCTLSCQGCHVNPNGGGIRNRYGVWTQDRWLKTLHLEGVGKPRPAPWFRQNYTKSRRKSAKNKLRRSLRKGKYAGEDSAKSKRRIRSKRKRRKSRDPRLTTENWMNFDEMSYQREAGDLAFKKTALTAEKFESRIPDDDPYWEEQDMRATGGGNLRYLSYSRDRDGTTSNEAWPMAIDLGVRYRLYGQNLSMVMEGRFLNPPTGKSFNDASTSTGMMRSSYFLLDNLPFNTYIMHGWYRPLFGLMTADHSAIAEEIKTGGTGQRTRFLATSIGTAPNVPFLNLHLITPSKISGEATDNGYAINLGTRFVSYSASAMFSYWSSKFDSSTYEELNKTMMAFSYGGKLWRFVANGEVLVVEKEFAPGSADKGAVNTFDLKTQLWRENYLTLHYSTANTYTDLKEGSASEVSVGFKGFLISGLEWETTSITRETFQASANSTVKDSILQTQLHLFF